MSDKFKPFAYAYLMVAWWVLPVSLIQLSRWPIDEYLSSYVPSLVIIIMPIVVLSFAKVVLSKDFWVDYSLMKKFLFLIGTFLVNMVAIFIVVTVLDSYRLVSYFGGDAGGSHLLFFYPLAGIYIVIGLAFTLFMNAKKRLANH